jgi:cephalosporin-C deacetylase-like acetyl esterase
MVRLTLALLALSLLPLIAAAQTEGDKQIEKYLAAETDKLSKKVLDGATNLAEWQKRRPRLRQEYFDMLGLWPMPEKTPLKATVTAKHEHDSIIVENLHFQSKPGLYVTANLYRPKSRARQQAEKLPAILYVCGHSFRGRDGNKSAYQDHGLWFAHNGYVCLILDTLQLGEIAGHHHGTYGIRSNRDKNGQAETRFWWHCRGYTPAGVECWNGIRAVDYLLTRPEVDPDRLGVTGISGGGAATFWIAAADERLKCAVPVSGMSDLECYVKHKIINGHCDCMFLYNTYQWEWTTIAALIAPRPLLFCNSDNDSIFPMDGNRRIIARLRKLYKWYGKPDLVDEHISHGGHAYRPDLRIAAYKWLNKYVKGDTGPVEDTRYKLVPPRQLRVFPEDSDIPKDALNAKIDEVFVPKAVVKLPEKGKFEEWRKEILEELRAQVFRPLPREILMAKKNRAYPGQWLPGQWLVTEPGIEVSTYDLSGLWLNFEADNDTVQTMFLFGDVSELAKHKEGAGTKKIEEIGRFKESWTKDNFSLLTRGQGRLRWTKKSPPNYVERSLALLGRTADQGQLYDIAAAARYLRFHDKKEKKIRVVGLGRDGILAAYAALFVPSIDEVVIIDPPKSHMQGPYFLNVLRVLDIPEALGLLAPRVRLTLINARDPAFDRTAEIYRLAGAADMFTRK